jgi:hypothetical protein
MEWEEASTDTLEQRLLTLEAAVATIRAEQAMLAAELDRRRVPAGDGCRTLTEWLTGRLNLAPETAARLARLSRTLPHLPGLAEAAAAGEISFDQAVEAVRLAATVGAEAALDAARCHPVPGLRRLAALHRRLTRHHEQDVFAGRHLALTPHPNLTGWNLWGSLPGLDGSLVEKALQERADTFPPLPDGSRPTLTQRLADALVSICQDALTGADPDRAAPTPHVTVFVDAALAAPTRGETGAEVAGGPRVGPQTLQALLCDGQVDLTLLREGRPVATTNATQAIPPAVRRYVLARDGGCTADGCVSRYRLQPHHIRHRTHHGDNHPDNLATLCWWHHHRVIHGMGYRIDPHSPPGRRRFLPPERPPPEDVESGFFSSS